MNKIALLKGGNGSEKEISLMTANACRKAFKELGVKFVEIDIKNEFIQKLILEDIDICFNALHGSLGENGSIPGLLNCLSSDPLCKKLYFLNFNFFKLNAVLAILFESESLSFVSR